MTAPSELPEIDLSELPADSDLARAIYEDLRSLAAKQMAAERPDHTLEPTALAHEAYLRFRDQRMQIENREHFFALAARLIRRILVDHARDRGRVKRGGDRERVTISERSVQGGIDVLELEDALARLESEDSVLARVVEMKFFAGRTFGEIATSLDVTERTVQRHWSYAKARLHRDLSAS